MSAKKQKSPHANAQEKYHAAKSLTHTKVCRWVPNDRVTDYIKSFERMKKKWAKYFSGTK